MNSQKVIAYITPILLVGIIWIGLLASPTGVSAATSTGSLTLSGTVSLSVTDSTIAFTSVTFTGADTTTVSSTTRYLYDSVNDGSDAAVTFDESTTNTLAYYYLNTTAFSAPGSTTVDNFNYAFYREAGDTYDTNSWNGISSGGAYGAYMSQNMSLTTASTTGSITKPDAAGTVVGDGSATIGVYISSDGNDWEYTTITLYYYSDGTTLYFDDDADMSSADSPETGVAVQSVTTTGDQITILGNPFVITSAIPASTSTAFQLYFGWFTDETANSVVSGTTMSFNMLFSLEFFGGNTGTYSVTTTITGAEQV